MTENWHAPGDVIVKIGKQDLNTGLNHQLEQALRKKVPFPKELAYSDEGMVSWYGIAGTSYQTGDEITMIQGNAAVIVKDLPTGTKIIDLGAADSKKYEGYVKAFKALNRDCTYIPLDLNEKSLREQVFRARSVYPEMETVGLWGDFKQGDDFFHKIPGPKLFLSLGSIFFNGPKEICDQRAQRFKSHLGEGDRLIVGQDSVTEANQEKAHQSYGTPQYTKFLRQYLSAIQTRAGIKTPTDPDKAWKTTSKLQDGKHFFEVTTLVDMVCANFGGLLIEAGTKYEMFHSWKRSEEDIIEIAERNGLKIKIVGKAPNSGMCQYLLESQ